MLSDSYAVKDWTGTGRIADLAEIYNKQIAGAVPHCYPVSAQEFAAGRYQRTDDDYTAALRDERVMVGVQGGRLRGYAHVTVGEIAHRDRRLTGGFIHLLTYEVGHREIGQALLKACEHHLSENGASTIRAFDGYFYRFHHLGFPLVSDRMAHVYGLFGMNGYKLVGEGEIFFETLDYPVVTPVAPERPIKVQVQIQEGRGDLPNLTVRALRDDQEIGSCIALSGGDFCRSREAQDRIFVDGLGVTDGEQGRGWGRYLLTRTLYEARRLGYRHAAISTGQRNHRAQLFYTNYGYRLTDTVYGFIKEMGHLAQDG